ncbi:MAG: DUF4058 family protein, partial [Armatimonadota bacterium]|nr:DUF4058 family protein [Armatimonadota bacterium]
MPSPFPGMDPYLEAPAGWQEFHSRFINTMSDFLVPKVRPKYAVYIERYVYVAEILGEKLRIRPDVTIAETGREEIIAQPQTVSTAKTVLLPLPELEEVRHYFLEIRELETQKVVTVIEMLSPFNKQAGKGRDEYLSRRNEILLSDVHLVELDLLREGERLPMGKPLPSGHYYAIISRSYKRPIAEVYAWTIKQPLPTIPIPLKRGDEDVMLDLQKVLDAVYDRAGY